MFSTLLKLLFFFFLTLAPLSCLAAEPVTGAQLEALLAQATATPDNDLARQLGRLALTERLAPERLARCEAAVAGPRARQQLQALASAGAFLDLPAAEIPPAATPSVSAQRQMLALTVAYVTTTMHQLPNFSAVRTTDSFGSAPGKPWVLDRRSSVPVVYRKGEELLAAAPEHGKALGQGLLTSGEFGPILGTVLLDAAQSNLSWSRWERGSAGIEAVFGFSVPVARSHYELSFCCIVSLDRLPALYRAPSAYHGEISIDPANGTILRVVLRADVKKTDPLVRADMLVEYGPVEIGGKLYLCPRESVAYSVGGWSGLGTWLNAVSFEQYHVFRSETRILGSAQ